MSEQMCSVVSTNVGVKGKAIPPSSRGSKSVVSSDALPYRRSSSWIYLLGMAHANNFGQLSPILLGDNCGICSVCWVSPIPQSDRKSACASLFRQTRDCSPNTEKSSRREVVLIPLRTFCLLPATLCYGD